MIAAACMVILWNTAPASAADLVGQWALSFPDNPTLWTFTQFGPSFGANTGTIPGNPDVRYDMLGLTVGPGLIGSIDYTELEGTGGTVSFGVLLATVSGEQMSGLLIAPTLGFVQVSGQRFTVARRR
jgi:hypothetical protein